MVEEKIKALLVEVLGLEDEEERVNPDADIFNDLAAESIDMVDICFRLEKDFGLGKVNPRDVFPAFLMTSEITVGDGNVSEEIIDRIIKEYPHAQLELVDEFKEFKDPRIFLKVKNIISFVNYKINK